MDVCDTCYRRVRPVLVTLSTPVKSVAATAALCGSAAASAGVRMSLSEPGEMGDSQSDSQSTETVFQPIRSLSEWDEGVDRSTPSL